MDPPAPLQPINQNDVFYILPWTRPIETNILGDIAIEKMRGLWVYGDDAGNRHCLQGIRHDMEISQQLILPLEDYVAKFNECQTRYNNFSMLLETYSADHDRFHNTVHASEHTWRQIQAERPDLLCYYNEGELNWALLKRIFTPPPYESRSESYGSYESVDSPTSPGTPEYPTIFP